MLLLYTVAALLAVVSVQSQHQPNQFDQRARHRLERQRGRQPQVDNLNVVLSPVRRLPEHGHSDHHSVNLASLPGFGKGFYRDRFDGQSFCSTINPTCCTSRDDDCSVQIGKTRCYCDVFCDQGQEDPWNRQAPDCCPDYPKVCKGAPGPIIDPRCRGDEFTCETDKQCIDQRYRCDGTPHCRDGSDEASCGCREDQFTCESDQSCINKRHKCDGFDNCRDGSDELECNSEFGITLQPDIVYLQDHASHVTHLDFTCTFKSRHNLRLQMTTEPSQSALQELPADRYSYFTTGTEQQSLLIKPNIRGIVCEAFDEYGDKVLYARAKVVDRVDSHHHGPQPIVNPLPAACNMNDINRSCGKYTQQMQVLAQSSVPDFNKFCCVLHEQVSCFKNLNCPSIISAVLGPAQAQIEQMCGSYVYTPGCADNLPVERPLQILPPNYAKCVNITNATPDTIVVISTFQDEQGTREQSSAIEAGGEYQFTPEERQVPGRSYSTSIPLNRIAVMSPKDGERVTELIAVTGVVGCLSRTIAYDLSSDAYRITE